MTCVSKPLYFGTYLAAMLIGVLFSTVGTLVQMEDGADEALPFFFVATPFGVYAFVVFCTLIYKMWKAVPASVARTTPGKAVGFLFIPLFNMYWIFPALWGWSRDWNSYAANAEVKLQPISETLSLVIAVVWVVSSVFGTIASFTGEPGVGLALSAPNYVLIPILIFTVCDRLNAAPLQPVLHTNPHDAGPPLYGSTSLVLGILSILVPYLGLVLGIVAIVLAKKQRRTFRESLSMAGLVTGIVGVVLWGLLILAIIFMVAIGEF